MIVPFAVVPDPSDCPVCRHDTCEDPAHGADAALAVFDCLCDRIPCECGSERQKKHTSSSAISTTLRDARIPDGDDHQRALLDAPALPSYKERPVDHILRDAVRSKGFRESSLFSAIDQHVSLEIAEWADRPRGLLCPPGIRTLASQLKRAPSTVQGSINNMVAHDLLRRAEVGPGSRNRAMRYAPGKLALDFDQTYLRANRARGVPTIGTGMACSS